jgi:hypothetical protein
MGDDRNPGPSNHPAMADSFGMFGVGRHAGLIDVTVSSLSTS